ncbi:ParA family protein [Dorea longicatena]|uniref:ParA family protein n=1 Tax=Dorea longicatena TaxID=88431 RepID=UPI00156E1FFA|nr:AAA family ATPase [Dorea longicatena]NSD68937.1 AAA family ATPase [Dorea longicatena]
MKTLTFLNAKGGTGKTASCSTIAHGLTEKGYRVLMIDLDPQSNSSALYSEVDFFKIFFQILKNEPNPDKQLSVEDLLMDSQLDPHECIKHTEYENLDIIQAFLTLSEVEERLKADTRTPQQFKLRNQLEKLKDEYDYCLIDCGPSISLLNINALVAADEVFIPARCDGGSLIGVAIAMKLIETVQTYNPRLQVGGIFLTQYMKNMNVCKTAFEILDQSFGDMFLPITIGTSKNLMENTYEQRPLLSFDKKSKVAKNYKELVEYISAPNRKKFLSEYKI